MNYIIGCGGVGSWITPALCLLSPPVTLIDGDVLEEKNLNRQLFTPGDVGRFKAEALGARYRCDAITRYYDSHLIEHAASDWIICAADNNVARSEVLKACDRYDCQAIFGANETHSAEAYVYLRSWWYSALDPRIYYPEILTDLSGDPMARGSGCTGEAQTQNPQLVSANFMAASLCLHLYVLWAMERRNLDDDIEPQLPYKLVSNLSRLETHKISDVCQMK